MGAALDVQTIPLQHGTIDLWRARFERPDGSGDELTHLEVALVRYLHAHAGKPVARHELLAEVWGYGEAVRTRAVDATVKRLRLKIEQDPRRPEHLRSAHGVGYAFFPASRATTEPEGQQTRHDAGSRVLHALQHGRLVTLTGPVAVGKSWIAAQVAERVVGRRIVLDVADYTTADETIAAIREAAGLQTSGASDWLAVLGPVTLLLDNADHECITNVVQRGLAASREARFVLTRRVPLGTPVEQVVRMQALSTADGTALFNERLESLGLDPADADDVERLVHLVDGLPGCLLLAADQVTVRSVSEVVQALMNCETSLGSPVHRLLSTALKALDATVRDALKTLSVFPGDFTLTGASAILNVGIDETVGLLESLVRGHWVTADVGSPTTYRLLHVVRHASGDSAAPAQERFVQWTLAEVDSGQASRQSLVAAMTYAAPVDALRLAVALDDADAVSGSASARLQRLQHRLEEAGDAPDALKLVVHRRVARLFGIQGHHARAAEWFERSLALARAQDASLDIAEICISLGSAYRLTDRLDQARAMATEGHALAVELGNARATGLGAWCLGTLFRREEDEAEARRWFLAAIEAGTSRGRGMALESLAILARRDTHGIERPERFFRQAIDELELDGDLSSSAHVSANLGCLYADAGRYADAREAFERTLNTGRRVGLAGSVAFGTAGLRLCDALQGRRLTDIGELSGPASALARTANALAWALDAAAKDDVAAVIGALRRAERHATKWTQDGLRLARAMATRSFAPEVSEELITAPGSGMLFEAIHPVAVAVLAGKSAGDALGQARSLLVGPDRAVLAACVFPLVERLAK